MGQYKDKQHLTVERPESDPRFDDLNLPEEDESQTQQKDTKST